MSFEEDRIQVITTRTNYARSKPMLGVIGKFATQNCEDTSLYRYRNRKGGLKLNILDKVSKGELQFPLIFVSEQVYYPSFYRRNSSKLQKRGSMPESSTAMGMQCPLKQGKIHFLNST